MFQDYGGLVAAWGVISTLQAENIALKQENAELHSVAEDLASGVVEQGSEVEQLRLVNATQSLLVEELESENANKQSTIDALEAQFSTVERAYMWNYAQVCAYNSNLTGEINRLLGQIEFMGAYMNMDTNQIPSGPVPTS